MIKKNINCNNVNNLQLIMSLKRVLYSQKTN